MSRQPQALDTFALVLARGHCTLPPFGIGANAYVIQLDVLSASHHPLFERLQ